VLNATPQLVDLLRALRAPAFPDFLREHEAVINWANDERVILNCLAYYDVVDYDVPYSGVIPTPDKPDLIAFIYGKDLLECVSPDDPARPRPPQVLCVHREQLVRYWLTKLKSFKGKIARTFEEFTLNRATLQKINVLNFILWAGYYFLIDNLEPILNTDTNVFLLLPTNVKWFDENSHLEMGTVHNWGEGSGRVPAKYGDMLHVVLPLSRKLLPTAAEE
jgi:hypothetical protein